MIYELVLLLRSESPSGMCAKLRTVAASNNRDHPARSLSYCLFAPHTCIFVLRAYPVRGESYNQRNTTGEVATLRHFDCSLEFAFSLLLLQPFNFSPVSFACNFQD